MSKQIQNFPILQKHGDIYDEYINLCIKWNFAFPFLLLKQPRSTYQSELYKHLRTIWKNKVIMYKYVFFQMFYFIATCLFTKSQH